MAYLRKRGKKWYYTVCWSDEAGRPHQKECVGGLTKAEAAKAWRAAMAAIDTTGVYAQPSDKPLADCLDEWLESYVYRQYKPNTVDSYDMVVRRHIDTDLGDVRVGKITTAMLQNWLDKQMLDYSYSTVKTFLAVLRKAFDWLHVNRQYIQRNPMEHVSMPRATFCRNKKTIRAFTPDEIHTLFTRFGPDHRFRAPMVLSYYTGLRLGECLALTWQDVDLRGHVIHVRGNLYDKCGTVRIEAPKTATSTRDVPFGKKLFDELKRVQWQQQKDALAAGIRFTSKSFVCSKGAGLSMTSSDMRYFGQYCHKTFGEGSFHWLRHTHATMLIEAGR